MSLALIAPGQVPASLIHSPYTAEPVKEILKLAHPKTLSPIVSSEVTWFLPWLSAFLLFRMTLTFPHVTLVGMCLVSRDEQV